jgi:hypothetical protein
MNNASAYLLLGIGLLQMTGEIFGLSALKGIGAAIVASPAPKVFSSVRGLETFSSRFFLHWTDRAGNPQTLALTPEIYARLAGPYNRRNVYGAALAYGPVLATDARTQAMFRSVITYAFCADAPLLRELGIDPASVEPRTVRVQLEPRPDTQTNDLPLVLEPVCQ